jgi:hypothetical protein
VLTVASGPVAPSGTSAALAVLQAPIVSTKQAVAVVKQPIAISSLRHTIGVPVKMLKPILVAGLPPGGGRSHAIVERAWERNNFGTPHAAPVLSAWQRIPEKTTQAPTVTTVDSLRHTFTPPSSGWGGMKQSVNAIRTFASPTATTTNRSAMPGKMLPARLPMTILGR